MKNRVYVFIEEANLWQVQKAKGKLIDFKKLKDYLIIKHNADEIKIYYYAAFPKQDARKYNVDKRHKFYTYLKKELGFIVRKKELSLVEAFDGKNDILVEDGINCFSIVLDADRLEHRYDTAVLFTGNNTLLMMMDHADDHSKKVYVYSTKNNISLALKNENDGYTDLLLINDDIWRDNIKSRE